MNINISELEINDTRIEFVAAYALKTFKLKQDRWSKMYGLEENQMLFRDYFDKAEINQLILTCNSGTLSVGYQWPSVSKSKFCYFVKKNNEALGKDAVLTSKLLYGDMSHSPIDQLSTYIDEVVMPLLSNKKNNQFWPQVVTDDVLKHVHSLKSSVKVIAGQSKGITLLPLPAGAENVQDFSNPDEENDVQNIVHSIETMVIDWTHQINDFLIKDSSESCLNGQQPLPQTEFNFWKTKVTNLTYIHNQLKDPKVCKMAHILDKCKSSYYPLFKNMYRNVVSALSEAEEINKYLHPIKNVLIDLEQTDFDMITDLCHCLMHAICIMWANSEFYNHPTRIVVLLKQITNLLINMTVDYLEPTEIFKSDLEVIAKIEIALNMLNKFKDIYFEYKNKLSEYFKNKEPILWEFPNDVVLARYDKFIDRVIILKNLINCACEFTKLEKIELGGIKGRQLGDYVINVFNNFNDHYKIFASVTYDCLDLNDESFVKDYNDFFDIISDLDRNLASIVCIAYDDVDELQSIFRLIDIFGSILERSIVREQFESRFYQVVDKGYDEFKMAVKIFNDFKLLKKSNNHLRAIKQMSPVAGSLKWIINMKNRLNDMIINLRKLPHLSVEKEYALKLFECCDKLFEEFDHIEKGLHNDWKSNIDESCEFNLSQPLLIRNEETNLIDVNFDNKLVAILREVRFLDNNESRDEIPASAKSIFENKEKFRKYVNNLILLVNWYNDVRTTVLEVEFPLIENQLEEIDQQLKPAETELNWKSENAWEYILERSEKVSDLEKRVKKCKENVESIKEFTLTWIKQPLYERKETKNESNLILDDRDDRLKKRYTEITTTSTKVHELVEENKNLFKIQDEESETWKAYVDYIDEIIVDGFFNMVGFSLDYLVRETETRTDNLTLFTSNMELIAPDIVFTPALELDASNGFYDLIDMVIGDIYKQASCFSRLAKHCGHADYQTDVENNDHLSNIRQTLIDRVQDVMNRGCDYRNSFDNHSYLWIDDRQEFLKQFLLYNHVLTTEEIEAYADQSVPECPPTLDQFKEQVDNYERIYEEINTNVKPFVFFNGWFRIDSRRFKQGLLNLAKRWSHMFKQNLINYVTTSLNDLAEFIKKTDKGISVSVVEGDYNLLVDSMGYLMAVKERQSATDQMFEPLKQTIELLKTYNQEMPEEVHQMLQELPEQWNNTKKISIIVKQELAPLQANEVANIRKKTASFDVHQHEFRERFRKIGAFFIECEDPYDQIDSENNLICEMEQKMIELNESAALFEVNIPEFKQIKLSRKELIMLKNLWDHSYIIKTCITDWKTTLWSDLDVERMDMDCKKFAKDIRSLDKEMRAWDTYTGCESTVKNMLTSLRAVGELQSPAIRERHWLQLMQETGVKFVMDDNTTLNDLLSLNLHEYEDEVKNIVDKAAKEMSTEKVLKELDQTWSTMELEHHVHPRTGITILRASEELIEILEDNQVQLQNMLTSKYIAHFLEEVSSWQQKLSIADQIISIYLEVQRTWSHLESIFIGSDDIRHQLPEDSERFFEIDRQFKELVSEIEKTKNVIEATDRKGFYEKLELLQGELTICEKALAEYLETKRLAFPRFYFVSAVDLLDILSNGNNPTSVCKHLTKLFDSMAEVKFEKISNSDENSKTILGMYSGDREYVDFNQFKCDCSGQVETWLNRLLDSMRATVKAGFTEAFVSYEEKPREQWLYDFPAQIALCCTQIWWTIEVNITFGRLEEGYENAMKEYSKKQIQQLNNLINILLTDMSPGDRQKIMTICTIDVHARDIVTKMIVQKTDSSQAFLWLSQLRHRWDESAKDCFINICDAQFQYSHEYLGNTPRLVITPLTDRCYITLTQSLHLIMSGAPAGPAGTGKTETTKDLGRAIGIMVYVFNCSEQMDYKSVANCYKGLAQSGAWGCFDEFNRISVEVLSVVAVQVKSIQDAIRNKKKRFVFMGEEISLVPTVGIFITMNPGYAGRTELPENLKALFRPCAMVVPDFELICEIMLVAEGFMDARLLARKFITLYTLCKELLSKQDHYDWGLRAIKSVLVVAGSLKRDDRDRPEEEVLMRALRDFNLPKIITDDTPVFMGLIGDLFPSLNIPRKRNIELETTIKNAVISLKLQPEEGFILKVVQLQELFDVRHSVFIIGNTGTGKTMVWKSLFKAYQNMKMKPVAVDINPKAVTNDELFGIINPVSREWKDGLFSVIMRDLSNNTGINPKWIVLDGDIDPMWIESLNTVMDDNKVLTLASNERIPLTRSMRLLFEISHLRTATPATVSRAGILYINAADLGWNPYVTSWIDKREFQSEKANLTILFDKYVSTCLSDNVKMRFKKITPIADIAHVQMLCYLLECLLTPENTPIDCSKEIYELYFVFCCIWAFGSSLFQDQLMDYRIEFSKWWVTEFKTIKFPTQGIIFDYYIDKDTKKFEPWTKIVPNFELDIEIPLQSTMVHSVNTTRIRYFIDKLIDRRKPVMLVGGAGTGKTILINDKLSSMGDDFIISNVPFNFYTTSLMLQQILESSLEKKAGKNFGPSGTKRLIYFIDDMNMPEVDMYFTVAPHTLIRQHLDYSHWYDRTKLTAKEINNTQYVSCMNPTAGSFTINPRLQRHFCVFALSMPGLDSLSVIYSTVLNQFLTIGKFSQSIKKAANSVVQAAIYLHQKVTNLLLPTAIKFHYIFNLRDLSNIFQGILFSSPQCIALGDDLIRIWMHEANRVYRDKFVEVEDMVLFDKLMKESYKKNFEDGEEIVFREPNLYCHFATGVGDQKYMPVLKIEDLSKSLIEVLNNYNDLNSSMDLILFQDAVHHILRINRILEMPRGNALLVGVGGSGKQSLSRLSAFISNLEVFQITLRKGYSVADLMIDLAGLYMKAGLKNIGIVFLMTDAQVADEKFLVLINDLLSSGEIPGLFPSDERDNIISSIRNETKAAGIIDTNDNCWKFFIDRVRCLLKVVLCFSPVGSALRVRSRKFPAITNCTSIDWFHEWPKEALLSVSKRFIKDVELINEETLPSVSEFMSSVHVGVIELSKSYFKQERRYNYTTPKSFLEQINFYRNLISKKHKGLLSNMQRLENGLEKLKSTAQQVDDLKSKLAAQEVELAQKNEAANKLISVVGAETEKVSKEQNFANKEAEKVEAITAEATEKKISCETDLAKAEPALIAAQAALDTLNKTNLTELKSFGSPPLAVVNVLGAVVVLLSNKTQKIPKDRSWKTAKVTMGKVDDFLNSLINYDKQNIPPVCQKAVQPYLDDPEFDPEFIKSKSSAAAGLCAWVRNIMSFFVVFCDVEPKRQARDAAVAAQLAAEEKFRLIKLKVSTLEEALGKLTSEFEKATNEKLKCQKEADTTNKTIELANRLVGGLASENVRWADSVNNFKEQENTLVGDVLLTTAFVSYAGCFTNRFRHTLMDDTWIPLIKSLPVPIPTSPNADPLKMLIDDAIIAEWNNQGLPADRMSTENATILTSSERWPLIIDPQLQGIKWIKQRYGEALIIVRLGTRGYLDIIERALSSGEIVLLENIEEAIDPVLDPVIGRNTIKKGRAIKLGEKEVEYHKNFRLIIQTKLANPHYKPELQAQTTLINFTVTRDGLEDQLLAAVVSKERPDLEKTKADLTRQQNEFKIVIKQLEDDLLARLSAAEGNFLGDYELVENLERTKRTATEIEAKVEEAKITEMEINLARELYRPEKNKFRDYPLKISNYPLVAIATSYIPISSQFGTAATRSSLLYFVLVELNKINPMYQFSLKAFTFVFEKAIDKSEPDDDVSKRVEILIDFITYSVFIYTTRGLFEKDKLIFTAQMTFQILLNSDKLNNEEFNFLLRFPIVENAVSPVDFLNSLSWGGIKELATNDEFRNLDRDIEGSAKRWKKFVESETTEKEKFPQEWKNKNSLQKLCMLRALRPDRMSYAIKNFIEEQLGSKYVENTSTEFAKSYEETDISTPVFFILSPGVDPLKDVEALGKNMGFTVDKENFHNISLGQGQETVAEDAMKLASEQGHWVVLQNIHLVSKWLPTLEKLLETYSENSHKDYRLYISAEPAGSPEFHIIPQGILESAIKITNEAPTGMLANLHKALDNFSQNTLEMCARENEFKSVLFSLCYFHAVVCERRKFGPQGWNRPYPFNVGDLTISVNVLFNYIEANPKVPWEDLRYLFGEIMYGGHITDDWDRRLCSTYLEEYMQESMLDGELYLAPGFPMPSNTDYKGYHTYIDECLPLESPYLYGLHPNAEIEFLTINSNNLFSILLELQPQDNVEGESGGETREEMIKNLLDNLYERLPDEFNMLELNLKVPVEERTPYTIVALQECTRMNTLSNEIRRSLKELNLGLKGELTISADMEDLNNALFLDRVPTSWTSRAYPSLDNLLLWYSDLIQRSKELETWVSDFQLPAVVWLSGFFNPQSFLTAIMQQMSRKNEWPLDKMCLQCDVTKKSKDDIASPPREGAYIHGLFMEGARWDIQSGIIGESRLKELTPQMPVIFVKAIPVDRQETKNIYACPVYKTKQRGPTFVWTFNLKTKDKHARWTLAGVSLLMHA
ncbi:Axonemal beta dynein heavy chain 17 [Intoshia linei]|uniref:Axonemal beta dynein heavy chain 17 n=1 Tax=Intoshia linei TaxID=1819745 RepID=A0A177BAP7_9BILA|nr:Axonemal beta dynein heavy chain 17 [Intoshia linei]